MARADALQASSPKITKAIICAFCTGLIGIGLARFAYTPLLPALVDAHWFAPAAAAYLGAANLAGYLAGAVLGRPISARLSSVAVLRAMMVLATAAFFACALPQGFLWFFVWRFAAGFAGGAMMVLAAPMVLAHVPPARRGLAGGMIFMGIGAGIAASGTVIPFLLQFGVQAAWIGLGVLSFVLTAIAWSGWPDGPGHVPTAPSGHIHPPRLGALRALYVEYALNAGGWVPHMIFLVDFVARGLGQGVKVGAEFWVAFGLSATAGPILAGHIADRIGFRSALRLAFSLQIFAIGLLVFDVTSTPWLFLSSIIIGAFVTGTVPLVLGRIHELLPHHPAEQKAAWSVATVAFALCQAAAAYGFSFIFAHSGGDYRILFVIGMIAMSLALVIDVGGTFREKAMR
ncbi:YbfB/YjiJ family MFS transporter [Hyphomicrobium sp. MC1]|uniref:YbfB/YjiJ family MFS transporter n=1 Tax=Hyphomicrobium sp. (strain MC1) TaxID=717785 RepID=UPI000213E190|nr:YbfB/YjiJ family MFS transporter [Hyphomicrobium sp. MC1]CCB65200.1 Major facilitator superfamily MFS_1 [Hyphomicrobium sp. MC1]